jgi:chromosome segregation ATPase
VSKLEELDKLDRGIKDAQIRLKSIEANIEQIDKEIAGLGPRKNELEQNIEFHKKAETVPIAQEYKKAKAELTKIKSRLSLITSDRQKADEACQQVSQIINKFKKDHQELLKNSDDNILTLTFGGKKRG